MLDKSIQYGIENLEGWLGMEGVKQSGQLKEAASHVGTGEGTDNGDEDVVRRGRREGAGDVVEELDGGVKAAERAELVDEGMVGGMGVGEVGEGGGPLESGKSLGG